MAMEAQYLIDISLAKITQARFSRGGVSLHKNLLVATVLQKAKLIFMEEISHMVHQYCPRHKNGDCIDTDDDTNSIINAIGGVIVGGGGGGCADDDIDIMEEERDENINCDCDDNENQGHIEQHHHQTLSEITTINHCSSENRLNDSLVDDADGENVPEKNISEKDEKENNPPKFQLSFVVDETDIHQKWRRSSLKRRKESDNDKSSSTDSSSASSSSSSSSDDDDVIAKKNKYDNELDLSMPREKLDNTISTTKTVNDVDDVGGEEHQPTGESESQNVQRSVDIERITSLVSIFNFTGLSQTTASSSLSSTPTTTTATTTMTPTNTTKSNELCSTQATQLSTDRENSISPRSYLVQICLQP